MNIQNTKIELIQWLTSLEDRSLIQKIMDLRNKQTKDWWNEISDAEKGKLNSHTEAPKIYEKWL